MGVLNTGSQVMSDGGVFNGIKAGAGLNSLKRAATDTARSFKQEAGNAWNSATTKTPKLNNTFTSVNASSGPFHKRLEGYFADVLSPLRA